MTREEKKRELKVIVEHLSAVKSDIISYAHKLEEIGCKPESRKLDTIAGKLENLQWEIYGRRLK